MAIFHNSNKRYLILALLFLVGTFYSIAGVRMPDFSNVFQTLHSNRDTYRIYEDSIHTYMDESQWLDLLSSRAGIYKRMYDENSRNLASLTSYFAQSPEKIAAEAYDSLYFWTQDMYQKAYDDLFLLEQFTEMMLPHYEACADTSRLIMLNHYAGYCYTEIARAYDPAYGKKAVRYIKRNIEYGRNFASLNPEYSYVIPADYVNICLILASIEAITPSEALALADDFGEFIKVNRGAFPEEKIAMYEAYLQQIRSTSMRMYVSKETHWHGADSIAIERMFEASPFSSATEPEFDSVEENIYYYHSLALLGRMSFDDAFRKSNSLFVSWMSELSGKQVVQEEELLGLCNGLIATLSLMEQSQLSEMLMQTTVVFATVQLTEILKHLRGIRDYTFFDYVLCEIASSEKILHHLPVTLKEKFLLDIGVKSQIGTVLHVNMVETLSTTMLDALINDCPEEFIGIMGLNSVKEVQDNRTELLQYISVAALFHDLGKNQMSEIVSNNFRHLTDHEFEILKMHPEQALRFLDIDPLFDKYKDVALGHHKWYNGKGGYPESFDIASSPWRPMIDVVTLCDCIDAATDYVSRSYFSAKTLDQVIAEFRRDAGTRYNPVMVKALSENQNLINRLGKILDDDRMRLAREIRARSILPAE